MKKSLRLSLLLLSLLSVVIPLLFYIHYITSQKDAIEKSIYVDEVAFMQKSVASIIDEKKKATTAIAITLAANDRLYSFAYDRVILKRKIDALAEAFRKNTDYQNVWFHIVDKEYRSLYKSWTQSLQSKIKDDKAFHMAIHERKAFSVISVDAFGVSIKAIAPFYDDKGVVAGAVEVISHFNSVAKRLKKLEIDSVVVVNTKMSQTITQPFTKHFINSCYIANFEIPKEILIYVQKHGIMEICQQKYQVRDGYIIVAYPLKNFSNEIIAYYLMFKKISDISKTDLQFFLFKGFVFGVGLFMFVFMALLLYFFLRTRKLKKYYKSILDSTTNILLICDGHTLVAVNKIFFHYFSNYKSLEAFKKEHKCICDFFQEEDGYLQPYIDGLYWMDYIQKHPDIYHKVKILIDGKIFYFSLTLSYIDGVFDQTAMVLSDITEQELYKRELEYLSMSDPLTHVGNRRKYEKRIEEEVIRACRYKTPLALIVFDLDHFKRVNDIYGHAVGDEVLREYSALVADSLRDVDEMFRIGGEEFVIIAPHTTKEEAAIVAEKLRRKIEESKKIVSISASFGVTEYRECEDSTALFSRADKALYKAKESGRNKVVVL